MNPDPVVCPNCRVPLPPAALNTGRPTDCPSCEVLVRADVYPALITGSVSGRPGDPLAVDSDSSCYFHARNRAAAVCGQCGRFVCTLCDMELVNRHYCPSCLETAGEKNPAVDLSTRRIFYDDIALALAVIPILFIFVTAITAPAALYIAIRHWNAPPSVLPRTKVRNVAAILLAVLQIAAWGWILYSRFLTHHPGRQAFLDYGV
jgi:hypothetical protein